MDILFGMLACVLIVLCTELVQDPVYYNQLLQLFIADDYKISPTDFLDAMEANNVKPDTVRDNVMCYIL